MGRLLAPFAVRGWIKVQAWTEYSDSLADYPVWYLRKGNTWQAMTVEETELHSKGLVVKLRGVDDREAAERLRGVDIAIPREQLPETDENEYYWRDLKGLSVRNSAGEALGVVVDLLESGANDLLVVRDDTQTRLIPFVDAIVRQVDQVAGCIEVEWGKDY